MLCRRDRDGNVIAWQARYTNPINPKLKVQRQFKPDFETQARLWLEEEHYLVVQHQKHIVEWVHPTRRDLDSKASGIRFGEFVDRFVKGYQKADGSRLRGNSLRNLRNYISHFLPFFKDMKVCEITKVLVSLVRGHIQEFCSGGRPKGMLFPAKRCANGIIPPTTIQAQFRRARARLGRQDIVFHSLRASHATLMMIKGGTVREVMNGMGHRSVSVAVKHYQRVVPDHQKKVVNLLAFDFVPSSCDPELLRAVVRETEDEIRRLERFVDELCGTLAKIG